ncbi:DUF2993 domain-containing protein [Georgenia sp. SYP-B2076]|uniref:LmeA family phospholipid-binding protein n=1 Tax=Georgenia sp. SYP-B2076 TaxID=2495881 RepID=UPI0013E0CBD6|nr:DUF2993 domain-containing protein [Georgenia sp. SYP-B2076]
MRRFVAWAALILVVLLAAAVVVDRVLHARAETEVAKQLTSFMEVDGEPDVTIDGFPFLTQVAAGTMTSVRASAAGVVAEGTQLDDVKVHARGVALTQPITAGRLEVTGTLPDAEIQRLVDERHGDLGLAVSTHTEGVTLRATLLGMPLEVLAEPTVAGQSIQVRVVRLTLGGQEVDAGALAPLLGSTPLSFDLAVPNLPQGLAVDGVRAQDGGVRLTLAGEDVVLG